MRILEYVRPDDIADKIDNVVGYMYETDDPRDQGEDMLAVTLRNGVEIDAGWSREGDPNGHFVINVHAGEDRIGEPIEVRSIESAIDDVNTIARLYSSDVFSATSSAEDDPISFYWRAPNIPPQMFQFSG